jgi:two-component system cell cycle sensor histidine kinase/response regulator CckA
VWADGVSLPAPESAAPSRDLAGDARKHIVVVDDDTLTLSLVERTLTGYRVSTARDGGEALAILSTKDPVHLLLTDYLMPVMTGEELVKRARVQRPDLRVLIMTGHGNAVAAADPVWWAAERHLDKPFRLEALRAAVESLIG